MEPPGIPRAPPAHTGHHPGTNSSHPMAAPYMTSHSYQSMVGAQQQPPHSPIGSSPVGTGGARGVDGSLHPLVAGNGLPPPPPGVTPHTNESQLPPGLVVPTPTRTRTIKSYHCRMCDQIFDNKSDLLVHSQTVHKADPKPYRCPTCQKCFANSSYLSQHARIHAGIKPYKCQICERRFTQLCHLQQHIRTHTGEKPYKCQHPGCGKAFSQLSNLQSHSRSHMTDKPYRCNSCYKCFGDEQGLRDHIPKHSETKHLKTFICRICGKSYTQETYLARHMTKHQGCDPQANMLNLTSLRHQQQQQLALQQAQQQAQQANHGGLVGPHGTGTSSAGYSPTGHSGTNLSSPGSQSGGLQQHPGAGLHNMSGSGAHGAASPHGQSGGGHSGLTHRQGDLPDIKPLLEGNGFEASSGGGGGAADVNKPSSAFMPLAHSYPGSAAAAANLITNTSVPSQFPFGSPPRLPPSTTTPLNSPLARLSPSVNSAVAAPPPPAAHHYFPFDFPRAARDTMDGRMGPMPHDLARSLISLQQIQRMNCVFPKSEPTTPAVAHKDFAAVHKDYTAPHKDYS